MTAFNQVSSEVLQKIYDRWKLTFQLIKSGKGTNEVVEEYRGSSRKPFVFADLPTVPDSECVKGYTYDCNSVGSDSDGECSYLSGGERSNTIMDPTLYTEYAFDGT